MERNTHLEPNPAAPVDAPIASLFAVFRQLRHSTDQRRSARHFGFPAMFFLLLALASAPGAGVGTNLPYTADYYGWVKVTCKLAYYAQFTSDGHALDGGVRLTLADPPRTNAAAMEIDGVVMEVLAPKELAGKTICIWLDQPAMQLKEVTYKPGVHYAGHWPTQYIGTLTFKGPVPFERITEPGAAASQSQPVRADTNNPSAAAGSGR